MNPDNLPDTYKNAVFEKDIEAFVSMYDEDVVVFDTWQQWSYNGLPAWRAMVTGWFASLGKNGDVVTFSDIKTQVNADIAMLSAIARFTNVSEAGEALRYLENRFTWVALKKGETWKIIHEHSSSPINFETMKAILKK